MPDSVTACNCTVCRRYGVLWAYAFEGTQITVTTLVAFYAGHKLDQHWQSDPWCSLAGATLGFVVGLTTFIRRALKL